MMSEYLEKNPEYFPVIQSLVDSKKGTRQFDESENVFDDWLRREGERPSHLGWSLVVVLLQLQIKY